MSLKLIPIAYAEGLPASTVSLIQRILDNIVNPIITLMVVVAIIYFLWGVFEFIRKADSSGEREKGAKRMFWGVVGLFIMASAYGIINFILGTIGK